MSRPGARVIFFCPHCDQAHGTTVPLDDDGEIPARFDIFYEDGSVTGFALSPEEGAPVKGGMRLPVYRPERPGEQERMVN